MPSIIPFDPQVLRNKLDSFVKRYKTEKQKQSQTGAAPSEWEYFTQMHRIRGASPKENGIPFPLDGGHDLSDMTAKKTEFPISDKSQEVTAESGMMSDPFAPSGLSFSEMLLNEDEHGGMDPPDAAPQSLGRRQFPTNELDISIDRTTTPPRSSPQRVNFDSRGFESATSPRTKSCSQPGIQGTPNKRRKSTENDEMTKTMKEFVGIYKESFEERKILEREKMELMKEMF
ncbi:hypothetical protein R1flu_007703 [Riccia fluitans]|uniref:No apical meristem-associated C-terminal domain-containing protein n=1 Tax=Riccia fluitans TaxID=41844 RepID=A0ABD1Z0T5_9MARC